MCEDAGTTLETSGNDETGTTTGGGDVAQDYDGIEYRLTGERRRPREDEFFLTEDEQSDGIRLVSAAMDPLSNWPSFSRTAQEREIVLPLDPQAVHNNTARDIAQFSKKEVHDRQIIYYAGHYPEALEGDAELIKQLRETPQLVLSLFGPPFDLSGITVRERTEDWDSLFEDQNEAVEA